MMSMDGWPAFTAGRESSVVRTFRNHVLALGALCWALGLGCSGDGDRDEGDMAGTRGGDGDGDGRDDGGFDNPDPTDLPDGGGDAGPQNLDLRLEPDAPMLRVIHGEDLPTVQFEVKSGSTTVPATFRVDSGELGRIDNDGLFTAS